MAVSSVGSVLAFEDFAHVVNKVVAANSACLAVLDSYVDGTLANVPRLGHIDIVTSGWPWVGSEVANRLSTVAEDAAVVALLTSVLDVIGEVRSA